MDLVYPDPPLVDLLVRLRTWEMRDLDCVRQAALDPRIPAGTSVPAAFSASEGSAFIERQQRRIEDDEGVSLAVAELHTDAAVGLVWLPRRPQHQVFGLGYWIIPGARNLGLGTGAVKLASHWAIRSLGAARVEAWVERENEPSQRLLSSAGFTREGVLRAFLRIDDQQVDAVVFSRTLDDLNS